MDQKKDEKLFTEFPAITTAEWEAKIREDLKGADYEKKLVYETYEGIKLKPYYRAEDLSSLGYLKSNPGETVHPTKEYELSLLTSAANHCSFSITT